MIGAENGTQRTDGDTQIVNRIGFPEGALLLIEGKMSENKCGNQSFVMRLQECPSCLGLDAEANFSD